MEVILFIGIQATGKSTFFKAHFADTHVRINLDMLKTRHRERRLFELCLELGQPCVIDNTNLCRKDRERYLLATRERNIPTHGFYFASSAREALVRNAARAKSVPDVAILGATKRLELPTLDEGFASLQYVKMSENGFVQSPWKGSDG
jgi:predicted kinase